MNQLSFIDLISVLSFAIALENLEENLTQGDKQDLQKDLAEKAEKLLTEIHSHLEMQDQKLDYIIELLGGKK